MVADGNLNYRATKTATNLLKAPLMGAPGGTALLTPVKHFERISIYRQLFHFPPLLWQYRCLPYVEHEIFCSESEFLTMTLNI